MLDRLLKKLGVKRSGKWRCEFSDRKSKRKPGWRCEQCGGTHCRDHFLPCYGICDICAD